MRNPKEVNFFPPPAHHIISLLCVPRGIHVSRTFIQRTSIFHRTNIRTNPSTQGDEGWWGRRKLQPRALSSLLCTAHRFAGGSPPIHHRRNSAAPHQIHSRAFRNSGTLAMMSRRCVSHRPAAHWDAPVKQGFEGSKGFKFRGFLRGRQWELRDGASGARGAPSDLRFEVGLMV